MLAGDLRYSVGGTLLDVFIEEGDEAHPLEFAPDYQGTATVTWEGPGGLVVDYTARLNGPMRLPEYGAGVAAEYQAARASRSGSSRRPTPSTPSR